MIRRGWDANRVRQTVLVVGMMFGLCIFGAASAHSPAAAMVWISFALGGSGGGRASGVDRAISDCSAGNCGDTCQRGKFLWADCSYLSANCYRLYRRGNAFVRGSFRYRDRDFTAGDCGLCFLAGAD